MCGLPDSCVKAYASTNVRAVSARVLYRATADIFCGDALFGEFKLPGFVIL